MLEGDLLLAIARVASAEDTAQQSDSVQFADAQSLLHVGSL